MRSSKQESNMTATYTIDAITMKLFGKKGTIFRLLKDGEVVRVFDCKAEAEAALAAA